MHAGCIQWDKAAAQRLLVVLRTPLLLFVQPSGNQRE